MKAVNIEIFLRTRNIIDKDESNYIIKIIFADIGIRNKE